MRKAFDLRRRSATSWSSTADWLPRARGARARRSTSRRDSSRAGFDAETVQALRVLRRGHSRARSPRARSPRALGEGARERSLVVSRRVHVQRRRSHADVQGLRPRGEQRRQDLRETTLDARRRRSLIPSSTPGGDVRVAADALVDGLRMPRDVREQFRATADHPPERRAGAAARARRYVDSSRAPAREARAMFFHRPIVVVVVGRVLVELQRPSADPVHDVLARTIGVRVSAETHVEPENAVARPIPARRRAGGQIRPCDARARARGRARRGARLAVTTPPPRTPPRREPRATHAREASARAPSGRTAPASRRCPKSRPLSGAGGVEQVQLASPFGGSFCRTRRRGTSTVSVSRP